MVMNTLICQARCSPGRSQTLFAGAALAPGSEEAAGIGGALPAQESLLQQPAGAAARHQVDLGFGELPLDGQMIRAFAFTDTTVITGLDIGAKRTISLPGPVPGMVAIEVLIPAK